ncbi:MAG: aldo/keto reductase [Chloroflexota bacterium]|nr:aldo/keto reductase [Chloroflexota bacterium]
MAKTYGFGIIPWSPLAGGLLTGKYDRAQTPPPDSRFATMLKDFPHMVRRYETDFFDVVDGLKPIASEKSCTLAQLSLAWCVQQPVVSSAIIGPRTMAQLEDNLGVMDVVITDEDRSLIDALVPPGRMVSPFYEADFGPHSYRV